MPNPEPPRTGSDAASIINPGRKKVREESAKLCVAASDDRGIRRGTESRARVESLSKAWDLLYRQFRFGGIDIESLVGITA